MVSEQSSAQQAGKSSSLGSFDEVTVSILGAAMDCFSLPGCPCMPGRDWRGWHMDSHGLSWTLGWALHCFSFMTVLINNTD